MWEVIEPGFSMIHKITERQFLSRFLQSLIDKSKYTGLLFSKNAEVATPGSACPHPP
jgi:hypothetical protein